MTTSFLQIVAQVSIEHLFNALPEGFLIASLVWLLFRVLPRQNSGTRFAVWFVALLTIAALPMSGGFAGSVSSLSRSMPSAAVYPAVTIPEGWTVLLFLFWAVGACLGVCRLVVGLWRLRQLQRGCTPVASAEIDPVSRKTVDAILASVSVTIATSDQVRVPVAVGLWTRMVVLPTWACRELPPDDLRAILLHEIAHLQRGDDWTNLIQRIVRAVFFFHPAVWWIETRLSVEREMACDDAVLAETANPHGYATCLVSVLEKSIAHRLAQPRWSMAQAAVRRAHEAAVRLARILDKNRPAATRVWKPALGMAGVFALLCLLVLSHAPQFVAFDRGTSSAPSAAYSAAVVQPPLPSPSVPKVAAAGRKTILPRVARKNAKVIQTSPDGGRGYSGPPELAVQRKPELLGESLVPVRAIADQGMAPQFQTLVFIQATQYATANSSVWRVQVWRVTVLSPEQNRLMTLPVANSI
jgi:beta-lactamase regulating signal transducer with metallopeptidase domain